MASARAFSVGEILKGGWALTKAHFLEYFALVVVMMVFTGLLMPFQFTFVPSADGGAFPMLMPSPMAWLFQGISFLLSIWFSIAMLRLSLQASAGKVGDWKSWFALTPRLFASFILASILVGLCIVTGFILLIIPGIILALGLSMALFPVLDHNAGPIEAIKESWRITKGNRGTIFLYWLTICGLSLLGIAVPGVFLVLASVVFESSTAAAITFGILGGIAVLAFIVYIIALSTVDFFAQAWMYRRLAKNSGK